MQLSFGKMERRGDFTTVVLEDSSLQSEEETLNGGLRC
jgi:hypothetical protein